MKFVIFLAVILLLVTSFSVHAAETSGTEVFKIPDLSVCKALQQEDAYGKKYDNMVFLLQGREGWIFRTQQDMQQKFSMSEETKRWFLNFQEALERKGIRLVVAFMPVRGIAANDFMPESNPLGISFDSKKARDNYRLFLDGLQKEGMHFVGTPELKSGADYFNKTDHHWATEGAREMAQAVAEYVRRNGFKKGIKKAEFKTTFGAEEKFEGQFARAVRDLCDAEMPMDSNRTSQTLAVASKDVERDLFEDKPFPDVVLIGTSNSKRESFDTNFEGFLKESLSADVYNAAITGGGVEDSLLAYLASDLYNTHNPKLMIWEIPGYYSFRNGDMVDLLRQALPALEKDCENPVSFGPIPASDDNVFLAKRLASNSSLKKGFSLHLRFSGPVKKPFSIEFKYVDGKKEEFKFKRSKRYPHDGIFSVMPAAANDSGLDEVTADFPEKLRGMTVEGNLCPVSGVWPF